MYQWEDPDQRVKEIIVDPFASPYQPVTKTCKAITPLAEQLPAMPMHEEALISSLGFKQHMQDYQQPLLRDALKQCQFNRRKAAKRLDLTYEQPRGYLRKYGLLNGKE